jgi:hypothetical protein
VNALRVKLVSERLGRHVHTRYFMGRDGGTLALLGELVCEVGEWQTLGAALLLGSGQMHGNLVVEFVGDERVVR